MRTTVGEVLPLALFLAVSPLNIVPAILLLFTRRPLRNATIFLVGFLAGVTAMLVCLIVLADLIDLSAGSDHSSWLAIAKVGLGACLVVAGIQKFRHRPRRGEQATLPKWMEGIAGYTPVRSLGAGAALGALNPKNVAIGIAAAAVVSSASLSSTAELATSVIYAVVASLGVLCPIVAAVVLGKNAAAVLARWRDWLTWNNAVVMATLFVAIGAMLLAQGFFSRT